MDGNQIGTGESARAGAGRRSPDLDSGSDRAWVQARGRGWGRARRFGVAALLAVGFWLALGVLLGGTESASAQTLRYQSYSQQYYSPTGQAQRRRNTCIMQRQVTPRMATMCGPGMICGDNRPGHYYYRPHYGAGFSGTRR